MSLLLRFYDSQHGTIFMDELATKQVPTMTLLTSALHEKSAIVLAINCVTVIVTCADKHLI